MLSLPHPPMTLGNMRELGVRSLAVTCELCHHEAVVPAGHWRDGALVRAFRPRIVCTQCGIIGADARPNWRDAGIGQLASAVGKVSSRRRNKPARPPWDKKPRGVPLRPQVLVTKIPYQIAAQKRWQMHNTSLATLSVCCPSTTPLAENMQTGLAIVVFVKKKNEEYRPGFGQAAHIILRGVLCARYTRFFSRPLRS